MTRWTALGRVIVPAGDRTPRVMGIVNVTPDSFSDGGRLDLDSPDEAAALAARLEKDGADLLDVGGESSRPGSRPVLPEEEWRRVIPAVEAIAAGVSVPISVDTTRPDVARDALKAGASVVNDITALLGVDGDSGMSRVIADSGAGVVLMHMRGLPSTMQVDPHYGSVVAEVYEFLARRLDAAERAGIGRERVALDPGIGFGKTFDHNLELLRNLGRFASLGCVLLIGTSRKGMLGTLTGRPVDQRLTGSVVSSLLAADLGAGVVRVHDVAAMADAVKVWEAVRGWNPASNDQFDAR